MRRVRSVTGADAEFVLPERPFENPLARAVLDVRRQLSLTPGERDGAATLLDSLAQQPKAFDYAPGVMLNMEAIAALLRRGREDATVEEAQARMWTLALALEEGGLERTARALEEARQAMRDAVQAKPDTPEKQAELDKRIQELREAIQRHMEALTEQARREGTEIPLDPSSPALSQRDLDRMAQEMQQAAKEGRTEDAQKKMAELERLLDQLQNARPESSEEREQRNAERRERGKQQMGAVQDMIQREGGMMDRAGSRPGTDLRPPETRPPENSTVPGWTPADGAPQRHCPLPARPCEAARGRRQGPAGASPRAG